MPRTSFRTPHRTTRRAALLAGICGSAFLLAPGAALAKPQTAQAIIERMVERAFAALRDKKLKKEPKKRVAKLKAIVADAFDWERMAKSSLGHHWRGLSEEQRSAFVAVYKDLLANQYIDDVDKFRGTEKVRMVGTVDKDGLKIVKTMLTSASHENIPIDYTLYKGKTKWAVEDVSVERVSMVNHYRGTFSGFLANNSFDELLKRLKRKLGTP